MGAVEEGGKVASGVVESLKAQPMILALVLFNCLFLGVVFYGTQQARLSFERTTAHLIDQQDKMAELLYRCNPAPSNKTGMHWDLLSNPYIDHNPKP